jgi:hypothetical protein
MLFASSGTADSESIRPYHPVVTLINWLVLILSALALLTGLLALLGSLYTTEGQGIYRSDANGYPLRHWQLVLVLVVFTGLVALNFTGSRRVRRVSSLVAVVFALFASVAWWWAAIDDLQTQTYVSANDIALGVGMILTAFSLGLQIAVGLLMFTAAFPLAFVLSHLTR